MAQQKRIQLGTMRLQVRSLASRSGLRIWHCHKLWCRLQTWLRSCVAVAMVQASSYSSNQTPSLGIPCAAGAALKRQKKKKKLQGETTARLAGSTDWSHVSHFEVSYSSCPRACGTQDRVYVEIHVFQKRFLHANGLFFSRKLDTSGQTEEKCQWQNEQQCTPAQWLSAALSLSYVCELS